MRLRLPNFAPDAPGWLPALVLAVLVLWPLLLPAPPVSADPAPGGDPGPPLPPWAVAWIESEGRHAWTVPLVAGEWLSLEVEQRQVDVVLTLEAPDGSPLLTVDRPTGPVGTEHLETVARETGEHRLVVTAWPTTGNGPWRGGVYHLRAAPPRPAVAIERRRAEAAALFARAEALAWQGRPRVAEPLYRRAQAAWRELGDDLGQGEVWERLAQMESDPEAKLALLRRARAAYRRAGDAVAAALAEAQQGQALVLEERFPEAVEVLTLLLPRLTAHGDHRTAAHAWQNLGLAHRSLDQPQRALDAYRRALVAWQALESPADEALTRQSLGTLLLVLGRHASARDHLEEARRLARSQDDRRGQSLALLQLGRLHREESRPREAFEAFRRAYWLGLGDPSLEAPALTGLGVLLRQYGRRAGSRALARDFHLRALTLNRRAGERRNEIRSLLNLGDLALASPGPEAPAEAEDHGRRALALSRELGEPTSEARARLLLARTARRQDALRDGLEHASAAVALWEGVRERPLDPQLRAGWFVDAQGSFDVLVDVLVDLHLRHPGEGWAERAFDAAERGRARSLLDLLTHRPSPPSAPLEARLAAARRQVNRAEEDLRRRIRDGAGNTSVDDAERHLRQWLDTLDRWTEEVRRASEMPRNGGGRPSSLAALRRGVLDADDLLLVFRPGPQRSLVWVVGKDLLELHTLAAGTELETTARRAHRLLTLGDRRESRAAIRGALCQLSCRLLDPVAGQLRDRPLWVVADGGLQKVPFAALPDPRAPRCEAAPPLVARHAVTRLPSASSLAALRQRRPSGSRGGIAVLADPVFEADDPRLPGGVAAPSPAGDAVRGAELRDLATSRLERLPHTRREASAIRRLARGSLDGGGPEESGPGVLGVLGLDATKDLVLSGTLRPFRHLHFATHGLLHPVDPALSGLVLSRWSADGEPRDGFLRSHEIRSLELTADLVVLSACRTALGREVAGEGVLGLPRAFLDAGARAVVVSLWPVADDATARLMEHFYHHLLVARRSPALALQRAQATMSRDDRWSHPYYWAGFVLVGDSTNPADSDL